MTSQTHNNGGVPDSLVLKSSNTHNFLNFQPILIKFASIFSAIYVFNLKQIISFVSVSFNCNRNRIGMANYFGVGRGAVQGA